ncbi:M17 family metallopeptidase [Arthrobacter sp. zg-Y1110]|uniref:leucyl aminopeptidase family protein n=1 Tax=Arthrobacter sp. zg-Y1110 TaxID=2886932 RepID=UPI001D133DD4|nr:leucyl aminopeptidase family protein [Arthrobacter sp. zg-Y1110]MCC3290391.1 leucyl aminopeptidase family protein [Arthrobacter sp. zg-Y1110]UWX84237.1 leucyl aminopeptidase family protein [Arthrobacter sp. zg-Y1110]
MQLPPKPTDRTGSVPASPYVTASLPGVTALAALNARTGEAESGTGLHPVPDEGVDVLAVAMTPAPAGSGREDADEAANPVPQPRRGAVEAALRYGADVAVRARSAKVTGKAGEILVIEPPRDAADLPGKLIYVGAGDESGPALRRAGAALARATMGAKRVRGSVVDGLEPSAQEAFLEGFLLGGYRPPRAGITEPPAPIAAHLELTGLDAAAAERAAVTARAVWTARDLTNTPAETATPDWMAAQARVIAGRSGLLVRVRDENELRADGFGGLLAVGGGSEHPPRLVEASYQPDGGDLPHVVLVGKGITFDSGGISLKPRDAMMTMKTDMAGAAAVLAVAEAAAALKLPVKVTAVLALAENAIGAASYRPADVVTTYNGTTVEVGNTDAEGRMVLADAMAYAAAELAPDVLVDVATLTGAAALGLGMHHAALFGNAPGLLARLEAAGTASGDAVWQLPLVAEYGFVLDSDIADISHIAPVQAKFGAGAIVAALFLEKFTGGVPWAHIDIAGPARANKDSREHTKGATGFGVRLLLSYLAGLGRTA